MIFDSFKFRAIDRAPSFPGVALDAGRSGEGVAGLALLERVGGSRRRWLRVGVHVLLGGRRLLATTVINRRAMALLTCGEGRPPGRQPDIRFRFTMFLNST